MRVRLTHIDGKLPNLALMKLAHWHRSQGHEIHFTRSATKGLFEPENYDRVYGSCVFSFSEKKLQTFMANFPEAAVGGTGTSNWSLTVEQAIGAEPYEHYDYEIYPTFKESIGFTQRGCRFKCGFCVVPKKEGKPQSLNTIADIWRGSDYPKNIHLLDNDFFGQPRDQWQARIEEIRAGAFKVCLNQGINIRMIDDDSAAGLASIKYYDDGFKTRRLYTAWDNHKDEHRFFRGVETLEKHGIPPHHLMVYMLCGYYPNETWQTIFRRFNAMVELGICPYPMIYGNRHRRVPLGGHNQCIEKRTLGEFQRWAIRKAYTFIPFDAYNVNVKGKTPPAVQELAL